MKSLRIFLACVLFSSLSPGLAANAGGSAADQAAVMDETALRPLLNAYLGLTREYFQGVARGLTVISLTNEAKSGDWAAIKPLLSALDKSGVNAAAAWFARPDGSYSTVEEGLIRHNLKDRVYFPRLMAGEDVRGELVISKSTGKRSAVFAVPVKRAGKVIGALGVSLDMEEVSRKLAEVLGLPDNMVFYALDTKGQVSLHRKQDLLFVFPSDLGSPTLEKAVKEMFSKPEGTVSYNFQGRKTVLFKKSDFTGWVYVLGVIAE